MGPPTIPVRFKDVIKNACRDFKILLEVMASFGGEEVIDFDSPLVHDHDVS